MCIRRGIEEMRDPLLTGLCCIVAMWLPVSDWISLFVPKPLRSYWERLKYRIHDGLGICAVSTWLAFWCIIGFAFWPIYLISKVRPGWPRFWELFQYILPKRIREKVYEPGHNELLDDYLLTRRKFRTWFARAWLNFCFTLRTLLLILDCWRVLLAEKSIGFLWMGVPERVKQWWWSK